MRVFLMTDMEGVACVSNFDDWVEPGGIFYRQGRSLLTKEVNAAIEGFLSNGFDEVLVVDGHGRGGIDPELLDQRARYQRGGVYAVNLDRGCDAIAWVGQHAKASTPKAHLPHTSDLDVVDQRINGMSVGEFGMYALMAASFGVAPIFGSGDAAFCREANGLCPEMVAVPVKEGMAEGAGRECSAEEYRARNVCAVHLAPAAARKLIYEGASESAKRFIKDRKRFLIPPIAPPYVVEIDYRSKFAGVMVRTHYEHPSDLVAVLNESFLDGHPDFGRRRGGSGR